jgi:hypothetical protein
MVLHLSRARDLRYKDKDQHSYCRDPHKCKEVPSRFRDLKCKVKDPIKFRVRDLHPKYQIRDHNRCQAKGLMVSYRARDLHHRCRALPVKQEYLDNRWVALRDHRLHIIPQGEQ